MEIENEDVKKRGGKKSREDSIIASFSVDKYTCTYDGNCWQTQSDDVSKVAYHYSIEGVLSSLLNKMVSSKANSLNDIVYEIKKAKHELIDAVKYIKFGNDEV